VPPSAHLVFKLSCTQQDMPELPLQRDMMIMESVSAHEDESTMRVPRGSTPSNHSVAIWDFVLRSKDTNPQRIDLPTLARHQHLCEIRT
jgi:hypothetical protein